MNIILARAEFKWRQCCRIGLMITAVFGFSVASANPLNHDNTGWQPPPAPTSIPSNLQLRANVKQFVLDNGLRVVVEKMPGSRGVVSHYLAIRASTMEEPLGQSGIAHVLEHMMFKHNEKLALNEYSKRVEALGGITNAFVNNNFTAYFAIAPKHSLAEIMDMEAKRMQFLRIDPVTFTNEMKVIEEERLLRDVDNYDGIMYNQLQQAAFNGRPQGVPIIGWLKDLRAIQPADVMAFYRQHYLPSNIILYIVGDVDFNEVEKLAKRYYGKMANCLTRSGNTLSSSRAKQSHQPGTIKNKSRFNQQCQQKSISPRADDADSPAPGMKRVALQLDKPTHSLLLGYYVPSLGSISSETHLDEKTIHEKEKETLALNVLSAILNTRFAQYKARPDASSEADLSAGYGINDRSETLFIMAGGSADKNPPEALEKMPRDEIASIKEKSVTNSEIENVKRTIYASLIAHANSVFGAGSMLNTMIAKPSWTISDSDRWLVETMAITPSDIQKVAQKYLIDTRLTIVSNAAHRIPGAPIPISVGKSNALSGGAIH